MTTALDLGRAKGQAEPWWVQLIPCRVGSMQGGHKQVCAPWSHQPILRSLVLEGVHIAAVIFSDHNEKTVCLENPSLHVSYCKQSGDHAHHKAKWEISQSSHQCEPRSQVVTGRIFHFPLRHWRLSPAKDRIQGGPNGVNWSDEAGMSYCSAQS